MASSETKNQPLVVSDEFLLTLAGKFRAEWLDLGRHLKLSEAILENIKYDNRDNVKEAKYKMLIRWKEENGKEATHIILAKALLEAGRTDLAENVKHEEVTSRKQPAENEFFSEQAASSLERQPATTEMPPVNQFLFGDGHMTADMRSFGQLLLALALLICSYKLPSWFGYPAGYGQFLLTLALTFCSYKLYTWFRYPAEADNPRKRSMENKLSSEHAASSSKRQRPTEKPSVNRSVVGDGDMTADMKEKKTQFLKELKKKYKNLCGIIQPAPFLRDKYDIEEFFVGSEITFLAEDQKGGREQENWIGLGDYKKIFTEPQIKSKRHIIDGEPGYGKSTLALQITHDWCQEKVPMNKFEILILLRLNQFKNVANVFSAIKKFLLPFDSELTEDDIKSILDSTSTVILLDGYDEYPDRGKKTSVIELIIRDEMFQKHEVVLTTRTSCLPPKYARDTNRIRLNGFDKDAKDAYIQNVVARGSTEDADKINHFFDTNPVPADLCKSPLFFAMISYMVHTRETFHNLTTVTQFFRHIIQCFLSHDEVREGEEERKEELDHSKLDEIAFEGLSRDAHQLSWEKNKLSDQIGNNLYDQYVRIGILIEEESYDNDLIGYRTETRFFHKLFAEWYAAQYLAKLAALSETEFEPLQNPRSQAADTSQPHQAAHSKKLGLHLLENWDPRDVHYMYRYACGLNPKAALKIITHLAKDENYDMYTLLCIADWGGSLEKIMETVKLLCSRTIEFGKTHSLLLQKSTVALVEFASSRKIPVDCVDVSNCLDVGYNGIITVTPYNLHLPVIDTTLRVLKIYERGREITEEKTDNILQYSAKCLGLKELMFCLCLLPRYIKVTESMSVLRQRDVEVMWDHGIGIYDLNLESGQWEDTHRHSYYIDMTETYDPDCTQLTDKQYQRKAAFIRRMGKPTSNMSDDW